MFDWNDLRFFLEVARKGRLVTAAQTLGVNHTTVARRIAHLEQALQTRLFEHTPTGYALTPTAEKLRTLAEDIESTCVTVSESVGGRDSTLQGSVRLGVPEGFGTQFIAPRLGAFYKRNPGIDIELVAGTQFLNISKREADLAITLSRPRAGRLVARKLTDYRLRLYGAKSLFKSCPPPKRIEDLKDFPLIGYIDDLIYAPQLRYLDEVIPRGRVHFRSSSINAQYAAVRAGLGLCVLPCFMADEDTNFKAVLTDEIDLNRTFWLSVHEDLRHVRRVAVVMDWLTEIVDSEQNLLMGNVGGPSINDA